MVTGSEINRTLAGEIMVDALLMTRQPFYWTLVGCMLFFPGISLAQPRDLYSDTWVATDALGRTLPTYDEAGPTESNKTVGIFYFLWQGEHGTALHDNTKIIQANPANPQYGPVANFHWWGEPEAGYFKATDPWVIRRNASMLVDAGVDFIYFDTTNGFTYQTEYTALAEEYLQIRAEGGKTPQFVFVTRHGSVDRVQKLYDDLYSQGLYSELWLQEDGKPLMLGDLTGHSAEVQDFFTFRYSWAWDAGQDKWQWLDTSPQDYGWHDDPAIPEQIPASVASHPTINIGTSHSNGVQPPLDQYRLTATTGQGQYFAEQTNRALAVDPEVLMITGWNEWVAQRFLSDGTSTFLGQTLPAGESFFVDAYNEEFNRDIEPMKGGHTDNFYYQLVDRIRRYKGVSAPQQPTPPQTIAIDRRFTEWQSVGPEFRDTVGDTKHRDHDGWGGIRYTNTTGRNDFITAKVTNDDTNVYFYAETQDDITPHTDQNWMMLFIDSDLDSETGWNGYDFAVNMDVIDADTTTLKSTTDGVTWNTVSTLDYQFFNNQMEFGIPRSLFGQEGEQVSFNFHWSDNMQTLNDIAEFFINGDSAPNRRFDYHFESYSEPNPVPMIFRDNFELSSYTTLPIERNISAGLDGARQLAGAVNSTWTQGGTTFIQDATSLNGNDTLVFRNPAGASVALNAWADIDHDFAAELAGHAYTVSLEVQSDLAGPSPDQWFTLALGDTPLLGSGPNGLDTDFGLLLRTSGSFNVWRDGVGTPETGDTGIRPGEDYTITLLFDETGTSPSVTAIIEATLGEINLGTFAIDGGPGGTTGFESFGRFFELMAYQGANGTLIETQIDNFQIQLTDLTADFDEDGDVDGADFLSWQRGLGTVSGATLAQGDANFDSAVNELDSIVWQQQFGTSTSSLAPGSSTVPEPTAWFLLISGVPILFAQSRKRTINA